LTINPFIVDFVDKNNPQVRQLMSYIYFFQIFFIFFARADGLVAGAVIIAGKFPRFIGFTF